MNRVILVKQTFSALLGLFFINVGISHFIEPEWFEPIVPSILGDPLFWVLASGVVEVVLGVCLMVPATRKWAGFSMAGFLVILYWANFNMWVNDIELNGMILADKWHVLRAFAQMAMILIALWLGNWIPSGNKIESKSD
jgi:uncharacterized membrane protein